MTLRCQNLANSIYVLATLTTRQGQNSENKKSRLSHPKVERVNVNV